MQVKPESAARIPVDIRRLSWTRLAVDYAYDFRVLAPFFAGNPSDRDAWSAAIAHARTRSAREIAAIISTQQRRRKAPKAAIEAAGRLSEPGSVAIVTGQQAGLFGGPLYTLLKSITAIKLAERLTREYEVPAVPIFWVEGEDHDWEEVRTCTVLDAALQPRRVELPPRPTGQTPPVASVHLDSAIAGVLNELEGILNETEFRSEILAQLRRAYQPGAGMAEAFARWLEGLLGDRGLVVFEAHDAAAKPLASRVFSRELSFPGLATRLASDAGAKLVGLGYHAQIQAQADSAALFHLDGARASIHVRDGQFVIGDRQYPADVAAQLAIEHPASFSPGVLLRPVVQDTLFPTVCYVAGPNELAYFAQLRSVYEHFNVQMPLVYPRLSATILDSAAFRFLTKYELPYEKLQPQDEAALNNLMAQQIPEAVELSFTEASRATELAMMEVARTLPSLDPTLEGAARSTLGRIQQELRGLHTKMVQAAKRRDDTLRRQFTHTRALAFPAGHLQERTIGFASFLNDYGPALVDRLEAELPLQMGRHWAIVV